MSAETPQDPGPGPNLILTADSYKIKGRQAVDLSWSGADGSAIDVRRDNELIHSEPAGGLQTYTDALNRRGGGSYRYQICVAGATVNCSTEVVVTF